jgi:hypothetical protein
MTAPIHAAEAGHWYWPNGLPAYEMDGTNGERRPTTLRDARKLGLLPSVTTIIKTAASPGLEQWKQRQVLLSALTLPHDPNLGTDDLITSILSDSKEEGRKAADKGTDIHAAVECYFQDRPLTGYRDIAEQVQHELRGYFGDLAWPLDAEKTFAHPLGFGGKVDLHMPLLVLDVKTKEFTDAREVHTYDEHVMQLAAYRVGLGFPYARAANVFVSTTKPGLVWVKEHRGDELARGWEMFTALLHFWRTKTQHYPRVT